MIKIIPVSNGIKYLGIQVTSEPLDFISLNLTPILNRIQEKTKIWSRLKMSLVGRINLIKMIFMPQLLYILHNTPMVIPLKMFRRIKLEQLQKSKESGGLALPNPWAYYLAAQAQHFACRGERGGGEYTMQTH